MKRSALRVQRPPSNSRLQLIVLLQQLLRKDVLQRAPSYAGSFAQKLTAPMNHCAVKFNPFKLPSPR